MELYLESQFSRLKQYQPPVGTATMLGLHTSREPLPTSRLWDPPSKNSSHRRLPLDSFR
jgi:hypothetical protein